MNALEMLLQRIRSPGALPGADGFTRISAGQSLARDLLGRRPPLPGATDYEGEPINPAFRQQQLQALPPGLPLVVLDSILNQPSYSEGRTLPPRRPMTTDMQREFDTHDPDSPDARNDQLETELFYNRIFPRYDVPLAEGEKRPDVGVPRPMYPSPLNQFMQRPPYGQY